MIQRLVKEAFQKLSNILCDKKLSMETKKRVLDCYTKNTLLYGSECWTISMSKKRRLEAVEMWFYRKMIRVSWTEHMANQEVLRKTRSERHL